MAIHGLSDNFHYFFGRLNPSPSFEQQAAREHASIIRLIESPDGKASVLAPKCFLQGSYKQQTATYTINDVDIVVLCRLWYSDAETATRSTWNRDKIFATIAAPLRDDYRYSDKILCKSTSMCIKVDLGIRVEILPVVYKSGNRDPEYEPFCLYRPESGRWEDGYARYHQRYLSDKNGVMRTGQKFVPMIKVLKHIRSRYGVKAVSFHIECLLYNLPDALFRGNPADYIAATLAHIAATPAKIWYSRRMPTPVGERDIFAEREWSWESWTAFHKLIAKLANSAQAAARAFDRETAITAWQEVLGSDFFPRRAAA